MAGNSYGTVFKITTFGESHGDPANARILSREIRMKIIYKTKPHSIIFDQA